MLAADPQDVEASSTRAITAESSDAQARPLGTSWRVFRWLSPGQYLQQGGQSLSEPPCLCRTIQVSRVVERVLGLSFLESNAVAPGTMDSYRKAVTDLEMFASEIGQQLDWRNGMEVERTCLEYLDLLFTQGFGPEVGNRLIAAIRTLFSSLQSSWRFRYAKDSEGDERVDKTDTVDESLAPAVDDGGGSVGDSLASSETRGRRSDRAQLCGLPSTWGTGNAAGAELGGTDQTRKYRSDRSFLPCDSGGAEWHPQQDTHFRRLGDPRQAGPLVDGSALESSDNGATWACSANSRESKRPGTRDQEHLRGARLQQAGNCRVQPKAWGALVGLHEKIPQSRRNSATGTLAQPVKRVALPKSFETPQCNAAGSTSAGGVRTVLRGQSRAPPRRPHGRPIFPWTGHRCFIEIGNAAASVSRAVKRRGVLAETWSSWYGTRQDISVEKNRTLLLKRIRRSTIAGIFLSPSSHTFSRAQRGKMDGCWPVAFRNNSCPKVSSGSKAPCGRPSLEQTLLQILVQTWSSKESDKRSQWTGSYMWSLDAYCRLRDLNPTISHLDWCQFGCRFRGRTTMWSWNLEVPTVLPTCNPRGNICSWSEEQHQHWKPRPQSARALGILSIPRRLQDTIASWFLNTWEQNALRYRWSSCRHSIPEYGNSGSIFQ